MLPSGPWNIPPYMERLWFLHNTADRSDLLHIGVELEIRGPHDPREIRTAFETVIGRHEAFAQRFSLGSFGPVCELGGSTLIQWDVVDVPCAGTEDSHDVVASLAAETHRDAFSLEDGPLIGATLFQLGPEASVLSVTAHQIVADARTLRILIEEFLEEWRRLRGEHVHLQRAAPGFTEVLQLGICSRETAIPASEPTEVSTPETLQRDPWAVMHSGGGRGDEHAFRLGEDLAHRLRQICGHYGVTPFTGLLAGLGLLTTEVGFSPQSDIGVIVTNRNLRRFGRTAGCFVQMLPLPLDITPSAVAIDVLRHTGQKVRELRTMVADGMSPPLVGRSRVMVSMVRDSRVRLFPPSGISVFQRRRRRVQAESELHVFIHDVGRDIEIVMNYDLGALSAETVLAWGRRYVEILHDVSVIQPSIALEVTDGEQATVKYSSDGSTNYHLHHVGLAVWELDIALRRLAAVNIGRLGDVVVDQDAGVVMALAGPVGKVALELVAPLRQDAPCVGALTRDGEGGYHCCWMVADVTRLHKHLSRSGVEYSVVSSEANTPLFPNCRFSFVVVNGLGLVEWLSFDKKLMSSVAHASTAHLRIEVESNDLGNANRFLAAMGYCPEKDASCPGTSCWLSPDKSHVFRLQPTERGVARIGCITSDNAGGETFVATDPSLPTVTNWWSRVRLGRPDGATASRSSDSC